MRNPKSLNFRVHPAGFTRLVREIWAEGSYEKCLNILNNVAHGTPLPIEVQYDIIRGKLRFAQYRNDPDQLCIQRDKWKPADYVFYPDPSPGKLAEFLKQKADEEQTREIARVLRGHTPKEEGDDAEFEPEPERATSPFPLMKRFGGYDSLEEMNLAFAFKRSVPTPEEMIETMHSRDEREAAGKPVPDRTLAAEMAWITPDGKFYACLTPMEHIWLVGQFGMTETQAENNGWIKITKDFVGKRFIHKGRIEPTQKQVDTLFDWCEKHKAKLPDWAGGVEA